MKSFTQGAIYQEERLFCFHLVRATLKSHTLLRLEDLYARSNHQSSRAIRSKGDSFVLRKGFKNRKSCRQRGFFQAKGCSEEARPDSRARATFFSNVTPLDCDDCACVCVYLVEFPLWLGLSVGIPSQRSGAHTLLLLAVVTLTHKTRPSQEHLQFVSTAQSSLSTHHLFDPFSSTILSRLCDIGNSCTARLASIHRRLLRTTRDELQLPAKHCATTFTKHPSLFSALWYQQHRSRISPHQS